MKNVNQELGPQGRWEVLTAITWSNWKRARAFLIINVLAEILLVVFIDIPSLRGDPGSLGVGEPPWIPWSFHILHLIILAASTAGLVYAILLLRKPANREVPREVLVRRDWLLLTIPTIGLICLGVVSGLDQLRSGDIGAFALNVMVVGVLLFIRFPVNFVVFTPGFVSMITTTLLFQPDMTRSLTAIVNGGIFYAMVLIVSTFLYNNQYSQLAKSTLLERANAMLDHLSLHDQLTGLPNRRAFNLFFERELAQMRRSGARGFLAVGDIDSFKKINDDYGHPAGDAVLQSVAKTLEASLRQTDTVARWGGEEFLLHLSGGTEETALEVLERTRSRLADLVIDTGGQKLQCTMSFGVTTILPTDADPLAVAYHRADEALYTAKTAGKNTIRVVN